MNAKGRTSRTHLNCHAWRGMSRRTAIAVLALSIGACAPDVPDVITQRNDNGRTGVTTSAGLNQSTVKNFRLLQTLHVDAPVLAQPLYLHSVQFRGAFHSVLWVATVTNKLYAFNADPPFDELGDPIDLGPPFIPTKEYSDNCLPGESIMTYIDGKPMVGIESTPVIDRGRNRMYVSYRVNGRIGGEQRIAAIDLSAGTIWRSVPVPGNDVWHTLHRNRMSLLLDRGVLYVGYSAINEWPRKCDYVNSYQGWIHAYDANTLVHLGSWRSVHDPNNKGDPAHDGFDGGGLWQASTGLAADSRGSLFFSTGNGTKNPQLPDAQGLNLSNAIVRIGPPNRVAVRAPNAAGNPAIAVTPHQQHIFYRDQDGSIQHIFWDDHEAPGQLHHDNWSQKSGSPAAAVGDLLSAIRA